MGSFSLSTQEVAALLGVTETSVKRWSDSGRLRCSRTPGGHRKFAINEVLAFAETNGHAITGFLPPPSGGKRADDLPFAVATRNYSRMSEAFLAECLRGDRERIFELLLYLVRHQVGLAAVADEVIRPALVRIGERWHAGELDVSEEHRASHAIADALVRLAPVVRRKPANGLRAVCACPEGEYHEIGLRCLAFALETQGWSVTYLGASTPAATLTAFLKQEKPDLICASMTGRRTAQQTKELRAIGATCRRLRKHYIIGGSSVRDLTPEEFGCDALVTSVTEAVAHLRDAFDLKPGPKPREDAE